MAAKVCPDCASNWPTDYETCPVCLEELNYNAARSAMTKAEAKRIANEAAFERAYWNYWDKGNAKSACGDPFKGAVRKEMRRRSVQTPEDLGALEAREQAPEIHASARAIRDLEQAYKAPSAE